MMHALTTRIRACAMFASYVVLVAMATAGCAPRNIRLCGEVTHKGRPVKAGLIRFTPVGDDTSSRRILSGSIENGRYEMLVSAGTKAGIFRVTISPYTGIAKQRGPVTDPLGDRAGPDIESTTELFSFNGEHDVRCD